MNVYPAIDANTCYDLRYGIVGDSIYVYIGIGVYLIVTIGMVCSYSLSEVFGFRRITPEYLHHTIAEKR